MSGDPAQPFAIRVKHLGEFIGLAVEQNGILVWQKSFDAAELDGLISMLGQYRAGLPEIVNTQLDPNARVEATIKPAVVMRDQGTEGFELIFRHEGYGWLSFVLQEQAQKIIGDALLQSWSQNQNTT